MACPTLEAAFAAPSKSKSGALPEGMGYCHCASCRSWSGSPVSAFSLWKPEAVLIKSGAEHVGMFEKTERSQRQYCKKCGGHLMITHPLWNLIDVFAATIPTLPFTPGVHVNYAQTGAADARRPAEAEGLSGLSLAARAKPSPNRLARLVQKRVIARFCRDCFGAFALCCCGPSWPQQSFWRRPL